jgi:hypothetical protein
MAQRRLTMETMPTHLLEALKVTLALQPADEMQRMVQREIINDVHRALEARPQRIVVNQSSVSVVKGARDPAPGTLRACRHRHGP